jgi:predicted nucleic acid-binding protein
LRTALKRRLSVCGNQHQQGAYPEVFHKNADSIEQRFIPNALRYAFYLAVSRKQICEATRAAAWQRVELDIKNGIYIEAPIGQLDLHEKAAQLAQRYTATFGTRTLDLLHIAAAILVGANQLLSFDERQRQAAKREGLELRPA